MVAKSFGCNHNRLKLLLDDSLSGNEQAELVGHLDTCANCQKTLESLAAEGVWWDHLRHLTARPDLLTTDIPPVDKNSDSEIDLDEKNLHLDFLNPSDQTAHLGRFGVFEITEVLGRGGMGIVLKAIDVGLNRPIAIKVLAPHFASSGAARKRFAREAQAAAAVVHDHVVPIHSVGSSKGLPYLVMAYVPGRSLQECIDAEGPLEVKEILRIGMQTALGLAAAHAQGLVHRDVKPANILLENGVQRVRITDFGLARAADDASLTQSGVISGTPQYMSPEQTRSDVIDHRTDLFSLGSTLYTMCVGHTPFRAESAMAVLLRIREEKPKPIRAINPEIPAWLTAIIEKLHAKAPEQRFQSAAEVAELLERCLAHVQQPDTNPLPAEISVLSPSKRAFSRRWIVGFILTAIAVVAIGVWPGTSQHIQKVRDENIVRKGIEKSFVSTPIPLDSLPIEMENIHRNTAWIEADLKRPEPPSGIDMGKAWLKQVNQRLDVLERELGPIGPRR